MPKRKLPDSTPIDRGQLSYDILNLKHRYGYRNAAGLKTMQKLKWMRDEDLIKLYAKLKSK